MNIMSEENVLLCEH